MTNNIFTLDMHDHLALIQCDSGPLADKRDELLQLYHFAGEVQALSDLATELGIDFPDDEILVSVGERIDEVLADVESLTHSSHAILDAFNR